MVQRWPRWVVTLFMTILVVLVTFELGSMVFYGVTRHKFFYGFLFGGEKTERSTMDPQLQPAEAVFHPYFSFINRSGRSGSTYGTNNHGWQFAKAMIEANLLCCDYPTKRRPGEVLVGVFGGSVGAGFSLTAQVSHGLVRRLETIPRFAGKKIRILNFAMSGFRQPQQLLTLAYYLSLGQEFDVVINIDGFNEVVTSSRNWESKVEPTYPADTVWGEMGRHLERSNVPLVSGDHLLAAYHERAKADSRRRAENCWIASCYSVHKIAQLFHQLRHRSLRDSIQDKINDVTLFPVTHRYTFDTNIDIFQYTADRWADSSLAMAKLMQGRGAIYVHILHPNQWYRKSGQYKPIDPGHIYKWVIEPVNRGYDALVERMSHLRTAGVNVLDATTVFKDINKGIYADDCCHYTDAGYDILFEAVTGEVARLASTSGEGTVGRAQGRLREGAGDRVSGR